MICDKCNAPIPAGARFCPACGDPVTAADDIRSRPVLALERVQLVCPKCNQLAAHDIPAHGVASVACPNCATNFQTRVVRVRSKRSSGDKQSQTRRFTVRVEDLAGRDDLIEFKSPHYKDFELRTKDLAAFSSLLGRLHVVQNLTVGRYMVVAGPPGGCVTMMIALGVVFLLIIIVAALL
ncbi:MAG TPA: zinc ribbon domain-containing protein [Longimicrobium sp.]|nr:zinc ribbon domain-containing protein [Longimicrobium sp.]